MKMNYYEMKGNADLGLALQALPKAEMRSLYETSFEGPQIKEHFDKVNNFKAVRVTEANGKVSHVACPTKRYALVQHEQAFRPIIEGLTLAGQKDYKFVLTSTAKAANLQIYVTGEGYDTVSLGFTIKNSFTGRNALSYGFMAAREKKVLEIVGYRQVCSNGMKIRVPLEQAEIVRPEIRTKLQVLLKEHARIIHSSAALEKIDTMQYVVEAMTLLREPVENMIKRSQRWLIEDAVQLKELIKKHVGKRWADRVKEQYHQEPGESLWDLYNAITHVASHDAKLKDTNRESLIDKAANMLTAEIVGDAA